MKRLRATRATPALLVLIGLASLLQGCRGPELRKYTANPGPYDVLAPAQEERLARARRYLDSGADESARVVLEALAVELPDNLTVGVMLQETELEMLSAGRAPDALEVRLADRAGTPAERLAADYAARAEERRAPATLVLSARLAADPARARELLEEALALDPDCIWAHYGLAFLDARGGESRAALVVLERALELDEGHLPSRRLEARLLQRLNESARAQHALESWLEDTAQDPRVGPEDRAEATVDLASALIFAGEEAEALEWLEPIDPAHLGAGPDLELLRAAALDSQGDPQEALRAAQDARGLDPSDPLPRVQAAMLYELRLGDPAAALEEWRAAASLARARALGESDVEGAVDGDADGPSPASGIGVDLTAMLLWAQSQVKVERYEAQLAAAGQAGP